MRALLFGFIVAALIELGLPGASSAQSGLDAAAQAGNWSEAAQLAESALAQGEVTPERWSALQLILGIALAHLGEGERAQRAFVCALALDPALRVPADEVIEVRSPFMEARGFWSLHRERLAASAELAQDGSLLSIALVDLAALTRRVVVRARGVGQPAFREWSLVPAPRLHVELDAIPRERGLEYSVALIDDDANRLWQLGSDRAPLRVGEAQAAPAPNAKSSAPPAQASKSPRPYYVGGALSLAVAAGALGVAGFAHAEREQLAERWNRGACAGEGSTRGEVCSDERDQLQRYERLAIGLYAVGAAALLAGIVSLVIAPARERRSQRALGCQSGPGLAGLACSARF